MNRTKRANLEAAHVVYLCGVFSLSGLLGGVVLQKSFSDERIPALVQRVSQQASQRAVTNYVKSDENNCRKQAFDAELANEAERILNLPFLK